MKVKVSRVKIDNAVADKINQVLQDPGLKREVHQELAETVDPWVPYVTGKLSRSGLSNVDANGVHYNVPYAEDVYNSELPHSKQQHPLASSHWDVVAMQSQREGFVKDVEDIVKRHLKG